MRPAHESSRHVSAQGSPTPSSGAVAVIVEQTAAIGIVAGSTSTRPTVVTDRGTIRADVVVRATEAYTRDLPGCAVRSFRCIR